MDPAAVQALTEQATVVVATTVAVAMGASVAGAASGPGALAIIGQVQMLSQTGKIGGGKTALGQMSDGFEWANAELPFSPWLIISDGLSMRRSQFQRRKNKIPPPGQTQKSVEIPEVSHSRYARAYLASGLHILTLHNPCSVIMPRSAKSKRSSASSVDWLTGFQ